MALVFYPASTNKKIAFRISFLHFQLALSIPFFVALLEQLNTQINVGRKSGNHNEHPKVVIQVYVWLRPLDWMIMKEMRTEPSVSLIFVVGVCELEFHRSISKVFAITRMLYPAKP